MTAPAASDGFALVWGATLWDALAAAGHGACPGWTVDSRDPFIRCHCQTAVFEIIPISTAGPTPR
ncbi:hypothetical protein [Planomonospora sp. ID82291]|uniref:hypothetical protein n=1 Tax=Planomonospora sp. ID82291 TaxID=2738136 RepID=UPI0018C3DD10|nr:hypothetical protein [Planomonospora sp. ID82291]MBG0818452.1 hypothetical protein [Planomonospora sp. ID82291]